MKNLLFTLTLAAGIVAAYSACDSGASNRGYSAYTYRAR
jgi:hypothetical protein